MLHYRCRSAFELWGHGQTHSELRKSLLNYPSENMVCDATAYSPIVLDRQIPQILEKNLYMKHTESNLMFNLCLFSSSTFPYSHHSCTKTPLTESMSTLSTRLWTFQTESKGLMWVFRCVCVCVEMNEWMNVCMWEHRNVCGVYACLNVCVHVQNLTFCVLSLSPGFGVSSI